MTSAAGVAALAGALAVAPPIDGTVCGFGRSTLGPPLDLLVPGTTIPLGTALSRGAGATMEGSLGRALGRPVLRLALEGGGLHVVADVDVHQRHALAPYQAIDTEDIYYAPEAQVLVAGFQGEQVLIWPAGSDGQLDRAGLAPTPVRCQDLHIGEYLSMSVEENMVAATGLEGRKQVWLTKGAALRDAPRGETLAKVSAPDSLVTAYVLEQQDGWTRLAVPSWQGVVWRGWVRSRDIIEAEPLSGVGGLGVLGRGGGLLATPERRACGAALPLMQLGRKDSVGIGTIDAGVPFEVVKVGPDGLVEVKLPGVWLEAAEGTALALPAGSEACPVIGAAAPAASFEELFKSAQ